MSVLHHFTLHFSSVANSISRPILQTHQLYCLDTWRLKMCPVLIINHLYLHSNEREQYDLSVLNVAAIVLATIERQRHSARSYNTFDRNLWWIFDVIANQMSSSTSIDRNIAAKCGQTRHTISHHTNSIIFYP